MTRAVRGVAAMAAACAVWGLSPLYYRLLDAVPPLELLAHRTLWSLVFFGLVLRLQGRLAQLPALLSGRALALTALAALMIAANWGVFILSVQSGRVMESALGYYVFPLVAVALGRFVLGERMGRAQAAAVGLAALAVALLTLGLGLPPWIALALGLTFGVYGLLKKGLAAGPVLSVTAEVAVLAPVAALWLALVHGGLAGPAGGGAVFGAAPTESLLLVLSGPLTAGPLILFSYASRRVSMATLGLAQYLNPTLQFLCAAMIFAEPFTPWHAAAFGLIWAALALYSAAAWRQERASRSTASSVGTSATRPT